MLAASRNHTIDSVVQVSTEIGLKARSDQNRPFSQLVPSPFPGPGTTAEIFENDLAAEKHSLTGKAHGFKGDLDTSAKKSAKNQALPAMRDRLVVLPGKPSSQRIARAAIR